MFENWIISEYLKSKYNKAEDPSVFFWHDNTGNEIDFLVEDNNELFVYEIKSGITHTSDMCKKLIYWTKISGTGKTKQAVIYGGDKTLKTSYGNLISWQDWGDEDEEGKRKECAIVRLSI